MRARPAVRAGLMAAVLSGAPSTLYAWVAKRPLLEATEAAGTILLPGETRRSRLVPAAGFVHLALSLFWANVLATMLPRRHRVLWGAAAGLGIGALDLLVIGRRWSRISELPLLPQLADHVAFGSTVAWNTREIRHGGVEVAERGVPLTPSVEKLPVEP